MKKVFYTCQKIIRKIVSAHEACLYNIPKFHVQIRQGHWETKKRKSAWIVIPSVTKRKNQRMALFMLIFSFFFSVSMSNLDMKFWDVVGTCFVSTHNVSYNFLIHIKYFFYTVALVVCEGVVALDIPSPTSHEAQPAPLSRIKFQTKKSSKQHLKL